MEPETYRLDREAMLADRVAAAERVRREIDEVVAAAAEKRRAFLEWFVDEMRTDAQQLLERERVRAALGTPMASGAAVDRQVIAPDASLPDGWEQVEVEPLPRAAAAR